MLSGGRISGRIPGMAAGDQRRVRGSLRHALVVDEDRQFVEALATLLENQGFTTNTATTLHDAREKLRHRLPDIALIDLRLPDGSGMDLLRELGKFPETEVVVITGHADTDTAIEALRLRAADYLTKPIDIDHLKEILRTVETAPVAAGTDPSVGEIERQAVTIGVDRIALYLQEHLGQRVTAYLSGNRDEKMVGQWAKGRNQPRELVQHRLRQAYLATRLLVECYGDETARAWFFGTNSRLGGEAPALVLRRAETPEESTPVVRAAFEFIEAAPALEAVS
jgi:ActR/RegA family two-component response regulator